MKRRDFLKTMSAVPAIAAVPSLAFGKQDVSGMSLMPSPSIAETIKKPSGNRLLTTDAITKEAFRLAHEKMNDDKMMRLVIEGKGDKRTAEAIKQYKSRLNKKTLIYQ